MDRLTITRYNDVHLKVQCDQGLAFELGEYFTFMVPEAKFSPAYKNKIWDGKIRLFHLMRHTLYAGLEPKIVEFAKQRGYAADYDNQYDFAETPFSQQECDQFVGSLNLPLAPKDYQIDAFVHSIRKRRAVLLSPTASGKSLIIYMLAQYYRSQKVKTLIVVPSISLVHQLASNFIDEYGCDEKHVHKIFAGQEKASDAPFVITTWQSIYNLSPKWFTQFGAVIGDEAHQFKAKSLVSIMENLTRCPYRIGLTGTLDGTNVNQLVLEGLFGSVHRVTTTQELIQSKILADLKIKSLMLKYPDDICRQFANRKPRMTYKDELAFLIKYKPRSDFISKLAVSLQGNSLILFNFIAHGRDMFDTIKQLAPEREVFFVYGGVEGEDREAIRHYVENNPNVIVVASYKTFSTGINIKNLHNVVFGSPSKSRIRVFQSIGRGLRVSDQKTQATLYDIADNLSWKSYTNTTLQHAIDRIQMYSEEKFTYKMYTIQLKDSK